MNSTNRGIIKGADAAIRMGLLLANQLAEEGADTFGYSPSYKRWEQRLLDNPLRFIKKKSRTAIRRILDLAAVVVLTMAVLFGAFVAASPGTRAVVVGTIIEWFEKYATFTSNAPESEKTNYEPTYIPAGFWEEFRNEMELISLILYTNEDDVIIVFQSGRSSDYLSVDNEGREYYVMLVDGIEYHVLTEFDEKEPNDVIWESSGQRYHLSSQIPVDELFEMAFSVGN